MVDRPARLEDYALIGNCQSAALVSRQGSIDWWCVPRFDSPACFAALLGTPEHGRFLITPTGPAQSSRRYRPDTMVLVTEHDTETGRVRVVDCLAMREGRPVLVRRVEGMSGFVPMRMELIVRFDYGSVVPWVSRSHGNWQAIAGPDGLEMDTPVELRGQNLTTTAEFTVQRRERVPFVLGWFPSHDPQPLPRNAAQLIARTTKYWHAWSERCSYDGEWRDAVMRSLLTLEALTYKPTGGIVAAPTTSLPEARGRGPPGRAADDVRRRGRAPAHRAGARLAARLQRRPARAHRQCRTQAAPARRVRRDRGRALARRAGGNDSA